MGNAGDTHCHQCGEGVETVRPILSQCCPKGFNLYMERHYRASTMALRLRLDGGNSRLCWYMKTIARRSLGMSLFPWTEILWPVFRRLPLGRKEHDSFISLRWLLPGILSRRKEEPRSSPSIGNLRRYGRIHSHIPSGGRPVLSPYRGKSRVTN